MHLKTPVHEIVHCVLAVDDGIERVTHLKVSQEKHII